jgi:hypothetical protein
VTVAGPVAAVREGAAAIFTITVSGAVTTSMRIGYRTVAGTAQPVKDYIAQTGYVTFTPGGVRTVSVAVRTIDDTIAEGNETFMLELFNVPAGATALAGSAPATIQFNDGGSPIASGLQAAFASMASPSAGTKFGRPRIA